jgi:hypothetical protein
VKLLSAGFSSIAIAIATLTLAGCVSMRVETTGAASIEDLSHENAYIAVYTEQMTNLGAGFAAFRPSEANPGVCNKGGDKQGCFDADVALVGDLAAMLRALNSTVVPPRFRDADRLLREAIDKDLSGVQLRNQAIATNDDEAWHRHAVLLDQAIASWKAAYAAFPADHRPTLQP